MNAPTTAQAVVGSNIVFQHTRDQHVLTMRIIRLDPEKLVQWLVTEPIWENDAADQFITWTLEPYEVNTLVDFRMAGWSEDDGVYANLSYKWASYMLRLKVHLGDKRDIESFLPVDG